MFNCQDFESLPVKTMCLDLSNSSVWLHGAGPIYAKLKGWCQNDSAEVSWSFPVLLPALTQTLGQRNTACAHLTHLCKVELSRLAHTATIVTIISKTDKPVIKYNASWKYGWIWYLTGDSRDTWAVQLAEPVRLIGFHSNWYENQDIPQKAYLGKVSRLSQGWFSCQSWWLHSSPCCWNK